MLDLLDVGGQPGDILSGILAVIGRVGSAHQGQVQIVPDLVVQVPDGPGLDPIFQDEHAVVQADARQLHHDPEQEPFQLQPGRRVEGLHQAQLPEGKYDTGKDRQQGRQQDPFPVFSEVVIHFKWLLSSAAAPPAGGA